MSNKATPPALLYDLPSCTLHEAALALGVSINTIRNRLYADRDRKEAGEFTAADLFFPSAYKGGNGKATSGWRIPEKDLQHYKQKLAGDFPQVA